ncbi:conserved hypothetical protein [Flavobacterium sp. 9AF]|uniref:hypothetical protein n=1 Tax=Flavobacterium sp. 9AF TaxID=2653142 RepID=UPI0012F154C2|nr:hypothetical protein [Flavobacterium sp. 9AF]VXB53536.1 conserved hypothetical protein [Flavobacterium sp. 9AF]
MKLVILTAIEAFDKEIKKMLKEAKILSYSYREVKGYRDSTEEDVEGNWFASEMNETDSKMYYAFVQKENVTNLFLLIEQFNQKQHAMSRVHVAVVNVELSM